MFHYSFFLVLFIVLHFVCFFVAFLSIPVKLFMLYSMEGEVEEGVRVEVEGGEGAGGRSRQGNHQTL